MTDAVHLSVAEAYDRWSKSYDGYDNSLVMMAGRALAETAQAVGDQAVLEFGCGTGRNLAALKAAGARRLAGLDLSEGMLAQARARDPAFELHRQDMALPAPYPAASFDLALFCLTLEHVADIATPLREAIRVLRPGGRIVVIEIHPFLSLGGLAAHFTEGGETVRMPTVSHRFEDYLNVFASIGLAVEHCKEWRPVDFADPVPERFHKRPATTPYVVEFRLSPWPELSASA